MRSLIDEKWWLGRVVAQEPLDSELPQSRYMCYTVIWDENDVTEQVSPWDLEPLPSSHFKDGMPCRAEHTLYSTRMYIVHTYNVLYYMYI